MNALTFRAAIEFDYAFLAAAFSCAFEGYDIPMQVDARGLEVRARPDSWDLATSFIAFDDDKVAGILCTARRGWTTRVAAMGVAATCRGNGVGRAMMQRCVAEARQRGDADLLLEVIESNTPALRLYESIGMTSQRRLVGFEWVNPVASDASPDLLEIDPADFAAIALPEYERRLPWQMRPETLANLTLPFRAFALDGRAFALVGDPTAERIGIRGITVRRGDRRQRLGTKLLRSLCARFPGKTWAVSPIVPEGLADEFFRANGFAKSRLAQREMRLLLTSEP